MPEAEFHFSSPWWLLALLVPLLVYGWLRRTSPRNNAARYQAYADSHLLPYLLAQQSTGRAAFWRPFIGWSLLWCFLTIAMAGPRWDYHELPVLQPGSGLVILLDLSQSMNTRDVAPSRLARARQEIEDLTNQGQQVRIGLIAFATLPHAISPLAQDTKGLRMQLPALSTDLVKLKGSRLTEALVSARRMLRGQPDDSGRHLLLITDGDFSEENFREPLQQMANENIHLHILGVGTASGGPVINSQGLSLIGPGGKPIISRLNEELLKELASIGRGTYQQASFRPDDTRKILRRITEDSRADADTDAKAQIWNERFYWLTGLVMMMLLGRFRRDALYMGREAE